MRELRCKYDMFDNLIDEAEGTVPTLAALERELLAIDVDTHTRRTRSGGRALRFSAHFTRDDYLQRRRELLAGRA